MIKTPEKHFKLSRLAACAVAAGLALSASASFASLATLSIDGFSVTTSNGYVMNVDAYQAYTMIARNAGGIGGAQLVSPPPQNDWNDGLPVVAHTTYADAAGNLIGYTDPLNLRTAGFSLKGETKEGGVYGVPTPPNYANANSTQAGGFTLVDEFGAGVAGDITFRVDYTFNVSAITGKPITDYAQVQLDLLASDDDENFSGADGLLSSNVAGGNSGYVSGFFEWTFSLIAGEIAGYTLTGSAIASSDIPEPSSLLLASLAIAALGGAGRRSKKAAVCS